MTGTRSDDAALEPLLARIAAALERLAPPPPPVSDLDAADAFLWQPKPGRLQPVAHVNRVPLALLHGIDRQRETLYGNTLRFAQGLPANNALLWGARGMGKSSLVKAVHAAVNETIAPARVALIEIHREDIVTLPALLALLRESPRRFILFCDDLTFETQDAQYKSLKAMLEGGIEGRPANVIFYATSNRRHMMPRAMIENEQSSAINPYETVEEKVSLSDRFGLWLGFHHCDQETYFAMVDGYAALFGLTIEPNELHHQAAAWSLARGDRSGRVAFQFIQDVAGRQGVSRG
jgi:predicted AAA+ superfamily ATPase